MYGLFRVNFIQLSVSHYTPGYYYITITYQTILYFYQYYINIYDTKINTGVVI